MSNFLTYAGVVLLLFSGVTFLFGSYVGSDNKRFADIAHQGAPALVVMTTTEDPTNHINASSSVKRTSTEEATTGVGAAPSIASTAGEAADASSERPWYPVSLDQYQHTFGTCGDTVNSKVRLPKASLVPVTERADGASNNINNSTKGGDTGANSNVTFFSPFSRHSNSTLFIEVPYANISKEDARIWEDLIPDMRETFSTEHERCHYVMLRMLAIFASVMKKLRLSAWFVSHATLLGAVRHGGFIPWDVDIDIAMPKGHLTMLRRVWRKQFPRDMFLQTEKTENSFHMWVGKERAMRIKDRYSTFVGMRFSQFKRGKRYRMRPWHLGAHIDIIPLEKKGRGGYKLLHHIFPSAMLFPTTTVCFENMAVLAPRNISGVLQELYGPNYMQIPKNVSFASATSLPCIATRPSKGSQWSLNWERDRPRSGGAPKLFPRSDPYGSFDDDYRVPYTVYANNRG